MMIILAFCALGFAYESVIVGNAKSLLDAARKIGDIEQIARVVQKQGGEQKQEKFGDNMFESLYHERPPMLESLRNKIPEEIDYTAVGRVVGCVVGAALILYGLRVIFLARQRRMRGHKSKIALPIDYRLQKRLVRQSVTE